MNQTNQANQDHTAEEVSTAEAVESEATKTESAEPTVIKAVNPTKEEMVKLRETIAQNYNFNVDVKQVKFNFKKSKDKETGVETIREAVIAAIPYPSVDGILAILEAEDDGKQMELLMDAMADVVNSVAREILAEDTTINAANFPVEKLSWQAIANMPKAQRRGGGIPKEVWEEFGINYIAVMVKATGKTVEQVTNMARILQAKLQPAKTNMAVLNMVIQQLAIYVESSEDAEQFEDCVAFLAKKADTLLHVSPEDLLKAL